MGHSSPFASTVLSGLMLSKTNTPSFKKTIKDFSLGRNFQQDKGLLKNEQAVNSTMWQ
jgi:hypothetical protein